MEKYFYLLKYSYKRVFVYKWSIIIGIVVSLISIYIMRMFWKAVYFNSIPQWEYMCNYIVLSEILSITYTMKGASKLCNNIREGSITIEFIRPRSYILSLLFEDIGTMLGKMTGIGIPLTILAVVLWNFKFLVGKRIIYLCIDIFFSYIILFFFKLIIGLFSFWVIEAKALQILADIIIKFFSGRFLPGWIMNDFWKSIMYKLPFIWIYQRPIEVMLNGNTTINDFLNLIILQVTWGIFMMAICWVVWKRAKNKLIIQGG